jgi:hypothetical protein
MPRLQLQVEDKVHPRYHLSKKNIFLYLFGGIEGVHSFKLPIYNFRKVQIRL